MPAISGAPNAKRVADLARELNTILAVASSELADYTEVIDIEAWQNADIPEILRTLRQRIDQALRRLER
jgi:hypothetical protein